jgi:ADP-ribose pyrophosphatase YjhB (NUDIX family)
VSATTLCVGVVDVEQGALLLVRRGHEPGAGRWSVPGGRVEKGETLRQAAEREAREETGLALEIGDLLGTTEIATAEERFVICDFLASRQNVDETPRAASDAELVRFVPLQSVGDLDLVDGLGEWLRNHGVPIG